MRRFLRFSVRDLLWLTLVVAVAFGWLVREQRYLATAAREQELRAEVKAWEDRMEALEKRLDKVGVKVFWEKDRSDAYLLTKTR